MGAGLEIGKLTSAAALHHRWAQLSRFVRYALTAIVVVLMVLTSSGIFAFTLNQYLAHVAAITGPVTERIAAADEAITRQAEKVADVDRQIAQIDATPALGITSTAKPRTVAQINAQAKAQAEALKARQADQQRHQAQRDVLVARRDVEAGELARLHIVRVEVGSQQQAAEAEVGPVKLLADLLNVDPGKVVAGAVASIYDLLAVLLLIVGVHGKPTVPAIVKTAKPAVAPRKAKSSRRVRAGKKAWATRRRRAMVASTGKPIERVK